MTSKSFDLIVIGGGPAGYVGAIRAAQRGMGVALVDRDGLGGTCLHRGCIPSKGYIAAAEAVMTARHAAKLGIKFGTPELDYAALVGSKNQKVKKLTDGIASLLKGNKVEVVTGEAQLESATEVKVGAETLSGRFLLLATGTAPVRPPFLPFDGKKVVTTDELFRLETLPRRIVVIGGGVIGCELASAYNLLGSDVTVVEMLPEILPLEGGVVSRTLTKILEGRAIHLKTATKVEKVEGMRVTLSSGEVIETDLVLAAIGRRVEDKVGMARIGVAVENGFVKVNERMETTVEGVYAAGDLTGKTLLAHGASAEAICAVENIVGNEMAVDYASIPRVTYTIPEVASVGARESDLTGARVAPPTGKAGSGPPLNAPSGLGYRVGRFSYQANGMAMLHEETDGLAEVYVGEDDRLLGAVVIGAHASDMIQQAAIVMQNKLPAKALTDTVFAHPTFGEILHEAAEDSHGLAIHKLGRR